MTDWTSRFRGDGGSASRPQLRAVTGTTLYMSTEELLAVLGEGQEAAAPATPPTRAERAAIELAAAPEPAPRQRVVRAPQPPPAPLPKPGFVRRFVCGRGGHDPRPHRDGPRDDVVYRCLRCGMPMPAPESRQP